MKQKAKDIMSRKVICIKRETPIIDAIRIMSEHNITGIPVAEDDMTLLGIISEQDVLRLFHTYQDEQDRTVNDFMTQPAINFEEEESLIDVCYCLRDNAIRRVPVTSNGKVTGIISRSDILKCILEFCETGSTEAVGAANNKERDA